MTITVHSRVLQNSIRLHDSGITSVVERNEIRDSNSAVENVPAHKNIVCRSEL